MFEPKLLYHLSDESRLSGLAGSPSMTLERVTGRPGLEFRQGPAEIQLPLRAFDLILGQPAPVQSACGVYGPSYAALVQCAHVNSLILIDPVDRQQLRNASDLIGVAQNVMDNGQRPAADVLEPIWNAEVKLQMTV